MTGGSLGDRNQNGLPRSDASPVKTVDKALRVLLYLGAAGKDLGPQEVARGTGLHASTAYRLLVALARHQFVQLGATPGRYRLGLRLAELGHAAIALLELPSKARPVLEQVGAETRETVHLMVLDGDTGIYVDRVESSQRIRVASSLGERESLHGSAVGKAILAYLPAEAFARITARGFERRTPRTIVDPEALKAHLRGVVVRGFAIDNEEVEPGVRCVGAPILDHRGQAIASISVAGPAHRLPIARLIEWGPRVRQAALSISAALGFGTLGAKARLQAAYRETGRRPGS